MQEELKPLDCPFCAAELVPWGPDQHNHPENDCWLSRVRIERHELATWNRRTPVSGEVAGLTDAQLVGGSRTEWGDEPPVENDALTCYKCGIDRTKAACAEPWRCPMSIMTPGVVLTPKQASEKRVNESESERYKQYFAYMDRLLPATMIYSGEEVLARMTTAAQGIDHAKRAEGSVALTQFMAWAIDNLGQGYSLEREDGTFLDPVTRWAFKAWQARGQQAGGEA